MSHSLTMSRGTTLTLELREVLPQRLKIATHIYPNQFNVDKRAVSGDTKHKEVIFDLSNNTIASVPIPSATINYGLSPKMSLTTCDQAALDMHFDVPPEYIVRNLIPDALTTKLLQAFRYLNVIVQRLELASKIPFKLILKTASNRDYFRATLHHPTNKYIHSGNHSDLGPHTQTMC